MEVLPQDREVTKRATTTAERHALAREARALDAVAHPGVVRLSKASDDTLLLERAGGGSLAETPPQPFDVTVGWGAALATTLADLHALGWAHCSLSADHVLFDDGGRPLLCSFGRAKPLTASLERADVAALAGLVADRLPAGADRRLRRAGDARALARRLVRLGERPSVPKLRRRQAAGISVAVVVLAIGLAAGTFLGGRVQGSLRAAGDYSLSVPASESDVAAMGRWNCSALSVAVLDRVGGWVWVFGRLPQPATRTAAELVGRVSGAVGIAAVARGRGCDQLEVIRQDAAPELIQVGR